MSGDGSQEPPAKAGGMDRIPTRRTVLALGAVAASTVVTVRPALAQTAGSVLNCQIPVPSPQMGGNHIAMDGTVVPAGTPGAVAPAPRPLTGRGGARNAADRIDPAGDESGGRAGLRQLHPAAAGGDERLHLLRIAADATIGAAFFLL
jgi:hypothetical protein